MEPPWTGFDFAVDVSDVYAQKMAAITLYESVFSGDQATLVDKYSVEDRYVGSLVGVQYAEAFRARSPACRESRSVCQSEVRVITPDSRIQEPKCTTR
jgi:hypothetical protein